MDNHSPQELEQFAQLSDQWWDPNGPMKPLHAINPPRCSFIVQHAALSREHPNKTLIDVGCGGGILTEGLAPYCRDVTGIDLNPKLIQTAQHHAAAAQLSIDYQCTPVETVVQSRQESWDVVTCLEVLEHVPDPQRMVEQCAQLCVPGGMIFFSTINRNLKAWLLAIIGAEYILNLLPRGTHHYEQFIQPAELNRWCRHAGLLLKVITGLHYNPWSGLACLKQDTAVNYIVAYQKT